MITKLLVIISAFIISLFSPTPTPQPVSPTSPIIPTPTVVIHTQLIEMDVPFTSQAPNYDWKDSRLQDGCEEAAVLMAYYWSQNKQLTSHTALNELFSMSEYQTSNYGEYRDTSLKDTANRLLKGYFSYENFKLTSNAKLDQIIKVLYEKHLVVLPMNGKLLHNPNYTGEGPDRHMLLLIGYDPETKEFITNDAGTWKGKSYRYSQEVIYSAIRDYSTGYHIPITEIHKNMLEIY